MKCMYLIRFINALSCFSGFHDLDASHEKLAVEEHHHLPLKERIPPCALPSALSPPVVANAASFSPSVSSGSSGSSAQQMDFAKAVRYRDDDLCVVCEAPDVDAAHIVPVKSERTAAGLVTANLLTLYDPRFGLTLCTLCHDTFEAGLWCIYPEDRATIIVSESLSADRPEWKNRRGQQVRRPSHHQDYWPSADTMRVQYDFSYAVLLAFAKECSNKATLSMPTHASTSRARRGVRARRGRRSKRQQSAKSSVI